MRNIKLLLMILMVLPFMNFRAVTEIYTPRVEYYANESDSNNYLSSVTFEGVRFNFDRNTFKYEIDVPYSMKNLNISYETEDSRAIVEIIGGEELYVGNNSLVIMVTSYDGTLRQYAFTINRSNDNSGVANNEADILEGLKSNNSSQVTVSVKDEEAVGLSKDVSNVLKDSQKTLIYEWTDQNGNFVASLKIDGTKVQGDSAINPNVKRSISNAKLLAHIEDSAYTAVSTMNTNIPKNSVYTMSVSGAEDIYNLYYYDGVILTSKPLRNIDGKIEFEVEGGYDYAIVGESEKPTKSVSGFSWIIPSIIITLLLATFIVVSRKVMLKSVKDSYSKNKEEEKNTEEDVEDKTE